MKLQPAGKLWGSLGLPLGVGAIAGIFITNGG